MDFNGQKSDGGMNIMKSLSDYSDPHNTIRHVRLKMFMPRNILKFKALTIPIVAPIGKFPRELL